MSTYGATGSATYSISYPNFDQMIAAFPNNTAQLIHAQEVRNMILTLWDAIYSTASTSANNISYATSSTSTITIGGLTQGTNFTSGLSIQQIFDKMFFPYVAPTASLLVTYNNSALSNRLYREYGSPTASFNVNWNITQGSYQLLSPPGLNPLSIYISAPGLVYYDNTLTTVYLNTLATQSQAIRLPSNIDTVFTLGIVDNLTTYNFTASVEYRNKMYWGSLYSNPSSYSWTSADILGLTGANVGSGNLLTNTRVKNFDSINGNGSYLIFAMPVSFGTPSFITNGLVNTAFSSLNINFTNANNYAASYSIWYSNTPQYSPITKFEII